MSLRPGGPGGGDGPNTGGSGSVQPSSPPVEQGGPARSGSRPRGRKAVALLAFALAAGVVGLGLTARALGLWGGERRGPVIARANGVPIFLRDARARVQGLTSVHGSSIAALGPDWQRRVLQSLVDDVIIQEEASRRDLSVSRQDLDRAVSGVARGSAGGLEGWLKRHRMSRTELERRARLQLLGARVYLAVASNVTVSEDEILAYYRSHAGDYTEDGRVRPLFEVRPSIEDSLRRSKQEQAHAAWLAERRKHVKVVILMNDWAERVGA
ncbi:MAG: SurA N-terminal domain-containing protein [Acidobacteria bacterium]|nr:SurA N-terminal domain-containing protein [Acidobacteriota bacterium]